MRTLTTPEGPIKICQIWLLLIKSLVPKKVVKTIPKIGYKMRSQSLKNFCQFIIRKILIIICNMSATTLSINK